MQAHHHKHLLDEGSPIRSTAHFTLRAMSGIEVPSGSVDITISFMGIQIFSKSEDLCSKTACPIKPGDLEIVLVEDLPPIAPPVSITQLLTLQASMREPLACERCLQLPASQQYRLAPLPCSWPDFLPVAIGRVRPAAAS